MIKNDSWILEQARKGMIEPFEASLIRQVDDRRVLSYGLSSYGYDMRLSPAEFLVFRRQPGMVINPKRFDPKFLQPVELQEDEDGQFFILPGLTYGLGVSLEKFNLPSNITALCIGKSTNARCGLILNTTPGEAAWRGYWTLEFSNSSEADCRIYAGEGIAQVLFLEGEPCLTSYSDRLGKYQDQGQQVVLARV